MDTETLKALADDNRLAIIKLLADRGELCVCDVATSLDLSDALVSHHVARLREAGLVDAHRVGRWLHVSLNTGAFTALAGSFADLAARAGAGIAASMPCGCGADPTASDTYPEKEEYLP